MKHHFLPLILLAGVAAACTTIHYQSPAPTREEVQAVRAQIDSASPERRTLTLAEADALARPVFVAISEDAARICRTVSEADSCQVPEFEIVDVGYLNARAGYNLQNETEIALTRGLVEQLADYPDGLALVIGHEYGHVIAAHEEIERQGDGTAAGIMGAALSVLAATSQAVGSGRTNVYYRGSPGSTYSQREIDEYLRDTADPQGIYDRYSKGEELEADYIGTYLAMRSGFSPNGSALIEIGALKARDGLSALDKQDGKLPFAYWDAHPFSPDRAARIRQTLDEIEMLKSKGYARPIPPRLILEIQRNNAAFHSLEELVAPLSE